MIFHFFSSLLITSILYGFFEYLYAWKISSISDSTQMENLKACFRIWNIFLINLKPLMSRQGRYRWKLFFLQLCCCYYFCSCCSLYLPFLFGTLSLGIHGVDACVRKVSIVSYLFLPLLSSSFGNGKLDNSRRYFSWYEEMNKPLKCGESPNQ